MLVGADEAILTERDLTRALNAGLGPKDPVAGTCVTAMIAVDQDTTLVQAATETLRQEIRHLLVHNFRGEVIGVVSISDLVRVLVDAMDPAVGSCRNRPSRSRPTSALTEPGPTWTHPNRGLWSQGLNRGRFQVSACLRAERVLTSAGPGPRPRGTYDNVRSPPIRGLRPWQRGRQKRSVLQ